MCVLSTLCGNVDKHSPFDIYIYIYYVVTRFDQAEIPRKSAAVFPRYQIIGVSVEQMSISSAAASTETQDNSAAVSNDNIATTTLIYVAVVFGDDLQNLTP